MLLKSNLLFYLFEVNVKYINYIILKKFKTLFFVLKIINIKYKIYYKLIIINKY